MENSRYMTFSDSDITVRIRIFGEWIEEKFSYRDFGNRETAFEEADRFIEIRKSLTRDENPGKKTQTGEANIRESVSTVYGHPYLYLQFYKGKLYKSISVGRLFNKSDFGRKQIRQTERYRQALAALVRERDRYVDSIRRQ